MPLLPTIEEEENVSWLRLMWRYRLQFQAMSSAAVVFTAAGMKLAWSVFESPSGKFSTNSHTHQLTLLWFFGVVVGAFLAATFVQRVSKNFAHCTSGALILFGGFLFIVLPLNFVALVCSCLCEGAAYGLTQVQALVTGGEVAHKEIRGLLLACERCFLWTGICLQLLCTRLWYTLQPLAAADYSLRLDRLHGILVACLGLAAIVLALLHRFESPLLLQLQKRDLDALYALKRLHGACCPTSEVMQVREDYKQLLAHDAKQTQWQIFRQWRTLFTLLKLAALRSFVTLSMTLLFNRAFLTVSWSGFGCEMNCIYILALCGLFGSLAAAYLIDEHGRRRLGMASLLLAGIFIGIFGGIFEHLQGSTQVFCQLEMEMATCLMLLYQLTISSGIAMAASIYTAEAFSTPIKAKCIAALLMFEQFVQISLAEIAFHVEYSNSVFFFSMSTLSLLLGLLVFFFMPETKYLTLSECVHKFSRVP